MKYIHPITKEEIQLSEQKRAILFSLSFQCSKESFISTENDIISIPNLSFCPSKTDFDNESKGKSVVITSNPLHLINLNEEKDLYFLDNKGLQLRNDLLGKGQYDIGREFFPKPKYCCIYCQAITNSPESSKNNLTPQKCNNNKGACKLIPLDSSLQPFNDHYKELLGTHITTNCRNNSKDKKFVFSQNKLKAEIQTLLNDSIEIPKEILESDKETVVSYVLESQKREIRFESITSPEQLHKLAVFQMLGYLDYVGKKDKPIDAKCKKERFYYSRFKEILV